MDRFERVAGILGQPHSIERSAKFTEATVQDRRVLHSFRLPRTGRPGDWCDIAEAIELPDGVRFDAADVLDRSEWLHLAVDLGPPAVVWKLYLEQQRPLLEAREASKPGHARRVLVHSAWSWDEARPSDVHRSFYRAWTATTRDEVAAALSSRFPAADNSGLRSVALEMHDLALRRSQSELFVLDVEEPGTSRGSVDVNLYPARLRSSDFIDLLRGTVVGRRWADDRPGLLDDDPHVAHLAGGTTRTGQGFMTIYLAPRPADHRDDLPRTTAPTT